LGFARRSDFQRVMTESARRDAESFNNASAERWFVSAGDKDV
jgi:hypothetical protein